MEKNIHFVVPESIKAADLTEKIQHHFQTTTASTTAYQRRYYDTFDWRLSRCSLILYWQQSTLYLFDINESQTAASMPWPANKQPGMLKTMAAGPLRDRLAPIIEMRSLLPLANPYIKEQQIHILNRDMKIIARLHLKNIGVNLTELTQEQADYIGVPVKGPYKPDYYRY